MTRLPSPGGDSGSWGSILNDYLSTIHTESGILKNDVVAESSLAPGVRAKLNTAGGGSATIDDNSVTTAKIADGAVTSAKLNTGSVTDAKIAIGITQSKITNLTTDLAGKASSSHTHDLNDLANVNTVGALDGQSLVLQGGQWGAATVTSGGGAGVTDHGALTGLADDDHPQYLDNTRGDTRYYTKAQVDSAVAGGGGAVSSVAGRTGAVILTKTDVGLGNIDNTTDASKPISTATQTALTAKATDTAVVHNSGTETVAGVKTFSSSPIVPTPTTNTQAANKQYVDTAVSSGTAQTLATVAPGLVVFATGAATARPTARTDLRCFWSADTAPVNAINGDVWLNGA